MREERTIMEDHIEEINSKRDKGFTLVELLIVIVILGILATVTVFAVRGITDRGKTSACQADKKTYETALEGYYAVNNAYPATGVPAVTAALVPQFIKTVPTNYTYAPVAGPPATFTLTGSGQCTGV